MGSDHSDRTGRRTKRFKSIVDAFQPGTEMKLSIRTIGFAYLFSAIAALLLFVGCGSLHPHERRTGQLLDDKVTAGRVQAALTNIATYNFPHVLVAATNGTVTLSGYVENEVQRQQAAVLALTVDQVKRVENIVRLRPPAIHINKPSIMDATHDF